MSKKIFKFDSEVSKKIAQKRAEHAAKVAKAQAIGVTKKNK